MQIYLINLARRPDRLAAMMAQAGTLALTRVEALDAATAEAGTVDGWFAAGGPLGEIPRGDKCCLLSHRRAWEMFVASGQAHAVFLEDDVRLSPSAGALLVSDGWIPPSVSIVKLEHYGPPGQRVLLTDIRKVGEDFHMGRCCPAWRPWRRPWAAAGRRPTPAASSARTCPRQAASPARTFR